MTGKDTSKLPLWARQRIEKLEADVDYYKQKALEATGKLPSRVRVSRFLDVEPRFLPDATRIEYALGGNKWDYLETHIEQGYLRVRSSQGLRVYPTSSGAILIEWSDFP